MKRILSSLVVFTLSFYLYAQQESTIYGINRSMDPREFHLGKMDLITGAISNLPNKLPDNFAEPGSQYSPAIDPFGDRYFIINSNKLWSIDLNTGEVLNSFDIGNNDLWYMQYNIKDSTIYGINRTLDPWEYFLGKIDLKTGTVSKLPVTLPSNFGGYSTAYTPAIDPTGNRYFILCSDILWSIDMNSGEVLRSYNIGGSGLWYMHYNILDSTLYGLNRTDDLSVFHLGKIDLNTGEISNFPNQLPSNLGFGSLTTSTIDPIGKRYFVYVSTKILSLSLVNGEVLNQYDVGYNHMWYIQYKYKENPSGIKQQAKAGSLKIYPNPTCDYINIESNKRTKNMRVRIVDIYGHVLHEQTINKNPEQIDISHVPKGVYMVEVIGKQEKRIEKVIKY